MGKAPKFGSGIIADPGLYEGLVADRHNPACLKGAGELPAMLEAPARLANLDTSQWPEVDKKTHTVFTSRKRLADVRTWGNGIAQRMEAAGRFPGLYGIADEALLTLRNCRNVIIENLHFQDCWPTAIYLDHCQRIVIRNCSFAGGTFAICARGASTRDIVVENCFWQQDEQDAKRRAWEKNGDARPTNGKDIWNGMSWSSIHGDQSEGYRVDVDNDYRVYDGDFFRAWGIAGNVTIRGNLVRNAFNAIHTFGSETGMLEVPCRNVLIEGNVFFRIRDNAVEPETGAANWVVRRNYFIENFRPLAFEGRNTAFFYIFGNVGWNLTRPGPSQGDRHTGASIFKFGEETDSSGPTYFFHNSWSIIRDFAKKRRLPDFHIVNNAVFQSKKKHFFGGGWASDDGADPEAGAFTKAWDTLGIIFRRNIFRSEALTNNGYPDHYPQELRAAGYPIPYGELGADPGFSHPADDDPAKVDLRPGKNSPLLKKSCGYRLSLPDQTALELERRRDIGAWQKDELYRLDSEFSFLEGMFDGTFMDVPVA